MLKGLEAVEVNFSELKEEYSKLRLDAEFFKKEYVLFKNKIKQNDYLKINDFASVTDGIHESIDFDDASNINLISAKSPKENYFDLSANHHISSKQNLKNPRTELKDNDVIISTVGTIGNCAVVRENILPANSDRHVGIVRINDKIKPYFLSTFLLSKYGRFQTLRESTGNVQLNLFIYKIKELIIPNLSDNFQSEINKLCSLSYEKRLLSKQTYTQAENLLLKEIGLKDFKPRKEPVNIKSFRDSFATSGRLDAEYYQPKYEFIENQIKAYPNGFSVLDDFIDDFSTGFPYKSNSYIESGGIPIIRINNINKGSLDISNAKHIPLSDLYSSEKDIAEENDILLSMSGTIGNSCKIPKGIKAVVNQRIMKITPKNFNFEVLPLLINSLVGELQLNKIGTGGVQTNISSNDIRKILIPNIYEEKQEQIADLIKQSFSLNKQSKHLLDVAKKAVEIAIEENEDTAINYINSNS